MRYRRVGGSCSNKPLRDDPADPNKITGYAQVRGLLKIEELSSISARANRSGSALKPTLMDLYDGVPVLDSRSRGFGHTRAERPFCTAVTTTQPAAVKSILASEDAVSGFANRWVFVMGAPKPLVPIGRGPLDIDRAVQPLLGVRAWSAFGRTIRLDDDAIETWSDFFRERIEPAKLSNDTSPLLARVDLTLKKLMLLFALNEKSITVTRSIVERVITLYEYLRLAYAVLDESLALDEAERISDDVLQVIEAWQDKYGYGPTAREILRRRKKLTKRQLEEALRSLNRLGLIDEDKVKSSNAGRPSVRYTVTKHRFGSS
jgi:hypothetical protein